MPSINSPSISDLNGLFVGDTAAMPAPPLAFLTGRQFRTIRDLNMAANDVLTIKIAAGVNIILESVRLELISGSVKLEVLGPPGAFTPTGTYGETLPIFNNNSMNEIPIGVSQCVLTAGGAITGGTVRDIIRAQVPTAGNQAHNTGADQDDLRGVPPTTFYLRLTAASAAVGVFKMRWEERP